MNLRTIEVEVLGCLLDDYESVESLKGDVLSAYSATELKNALEVPCGLGLANRYVYENLSGKYVQRGSPPGNDQEESSWYLASDAGLVYIDSSQ